MTGRAKRWVLNTRDGILHDRKYLTEQCNTDDIETRYYFASRDNAEVTGHLAYRRHCKWCKPPKAPVRVENPFDSDSSDAAPA